MRLTDQIRALCDQIDGGAVVPPVVPPVVVIPPVVSGDIAAQARAAAAAAGFLKCMFYMWDWRQGGITVQTRTEGGIGDNGVVIIAFTVPTNAAPGGVGSVVVPGWPQTVPGFRNVSLSLNPCDFTPHAGPDPNAGTWVHSGNDAGIGFSIGPYMRPGMFAPLVPGSLYFLNVASHEDVRITATAP